VKEELQKHKKALGEKSLIETDETERHIFFNFNDNEELLQFTVDSHFMNCGKPLGVTYLNDKKEICQVLVKKNDFNWYVEHYDDEPHIVFDNLPAAINEYLSEK
jgi:hypothetical protein